MTTTFDIQAAEERYAAYVSECPTSFGSEEARRAWHLTNALLRDLGATQEQSDWVCNLLVTSETAEFSRGFRAGYKAGGAA